MSAAELVTALGWLVSLLGAYYLGLVGADRKRRIDLADTIRARLGGRQNFSVPGLAGSSDDLHRLVQLTPVLVRRRLRQAVAEYEAAEADGQQNAEYGGRELRDPERVEAAHAALMRLLP